MPRGIAGFLLELEDRKTQKKFKEKELEFQETVQKPYMEALTNYNNAMADRIASDLLDDSTQQLKNNQALLTKEQYRAEKAKNDLLLKGLNSSDEEERKGARDMILGIDMSKQLNIEFNRLRTMFAGQEVAIHALSEQRQQDAASLDKFSSLLSLIVGNEKLVQEVYGKRLTGDMEKEFLSNILGKKAPMKVKKGGLFGGYEFLEDMNEPNALAPDVNLEAQLNALGGG